MTTLDAPAAAYAAALAQHTAVFARLDSLRVPFANAVALTAKRLSEGRKLMLCGNGGSAADSQHIAAEFVGRFRRSRRALAALALTTDASVMTCVANDYEFAQVFARQVEALGLPGDVLMVYSTSGRSPNVLQALQAARSAGIATIAFLGGDGGTAGELCDIALVVPDSNTARIQEAHGFLGHCLCEAVEHALGLAEPPPGSSAQSPAPAASATAR